MSYGACSPQIGDLDELSHSAVGSGFHSLQVSNEAKVGHFSFVLIETPDDDHLMYYFFDKAWKVDLSPACRARKGKTDREMNGIVGVLGSLGSG